MQTERKVKIKASIKASDKIPFLLHCSVFDPPSRYYALGHAANLTKNVKSSHMQSIDAQTTTKSTFITFISFVARGSPDAQMSMTRQISLNNKINEFLFE